MELVAIVFAEIFTVIFSVLVFALFIPIKFACPYCQAKFYYQSDRQECPECHGRLILDDQEAGDSDPDGIVELESQICYKCGAEISCQVDLCPHCGCRFDD